MFKQYSKLSMCVMFSFSIALLGSPNATAHIRSHPQQIPTNEVDEDTPIENNFEQPEIQDNIPLEITSEELNPTGTLSPIPEELNPTGNSELTPKDVDEANTSIDSEKRSTSTDTSAVYEPTIELAKTTPPPVVEVEDTCIMQDLTTLGKIFQNALNVARNREVDLDIRFPLGIFWLYDNLVTNSNAFIYDKSQASIDKRRNLYNDLLQRWYGNNIPENGRFIFFRDVYNQMSEAGRENLYLFAFSTSSMDLKQLKTVATTTVFEETQSLDMYPVYIHNNHSKLYMFPPPAQSDETINYNLYNIKNTTLDGIYIPSDTSRAEMVLLPPHSNRSINVVNTYRASIRDSQIGTWTVQNKQLNYALMEDLLKIVSFHLRALSGPSLDQNTAAPSSAGLDAPNYEQIAEFPPSYEEVTELSSH